MKPQMPKEQQRTVLVILGCALLLGFLLGALSMILWIPHRANLSERSPELTDGNHDFSVDGRTEATLIVLTDSNDIYKNVESYECTPGVETRYTDSEFGVQNVLYMSTWKHHPATGYCLLVGHNVASAYCNIIPDMCHST